MKTWLPLSFILLLFCFSCRNEMRKLNYGKDNCEQCRMTVMNPQFGAGILTSRGKVFTFDSGECMVRYLKAKGVNPNDQYFVSDYTKPGTLINAMKASFLHGDNVQSPMGGNLAAFSSITSAQAARSELGGDLLTWAQLVSKK